MYQRKLNVSLSDSSSLFGIAGNIHKARALKCFDCSINLRTLRHSKVCKAFHYSRGFGTLAVPIVLNVPQL